MKRFPILTVGLAAMIGLPSVLADATIHARLTGYEETPSTLSTPASGEFKAKITQENTIEYELTYADLEGDITQSHVHFGAAGLGGGIAAWLCGTTTNPGPTGTPACDGVRSGSASGVITADQVIGPAGQGIAPGEFDALIDAIREGATYVNVHSALRPSGEIRGQVR